MLNLGKVEPGSTLRIPFDTFAAATGAPTALSNFAVGDILIYKDSGTTERASTTGFTATTTFDTITGLNEIIIDLSSDATGDFFKCGSKYYIGISPVTADGQTLAFWGAMFEIGYNAAILNTSIATLASQTSFTLTVGPAEDDALNGLWCLIHDKASAVQKSWAVVLDYTGATKTVTLATLPVLTFTVAAIDNISFFGPAPLQPSVMGAVTVVQTGDNFARLGAPAGASVSADIAAIKAQTATINADTDDIQTRIPAALVGGRMDSNIQAIANAVISAATFAAGAIDASAIAASAIGASEFDQAAADKVWASAARTLTSPNNVFAVKKNAQLANFMFYMVLAADHITPATGLTVACQRSIDGAAFANCTNTPATEVSAGWYKITLEAADLNGTIIAFKATSATADNRNLLILTQT